MHTYITWDAAYIVDKESLPQITFHSIFIKLAVTSKIVLSFVYRCNHNSLRESCKFDRVVCLEHSRARRVYTVVYTCTRPYMARTRPCPRLCSLPWAPYTYPFDTDIAIFIRRTAITRSPAIAEGPRDAGVPVEIW